MQSSAVLGVSSNASSNSAIHAAEHIHPATAIDAFLRRELYSLSHVLRCKDLSMLTPHEWGSLRQCYRELHLWKLALSMSEVGQSRQRRGSVRSEYNMLTSTIHSALLLWALLLRDYPTVVAMLESRFANFPSMEPATPLPLDDGGSYGNGSGVDASSSSIGATRTKIDPLQPLKQRWVNLISMLLIHSVLRTYRQNFVQTFIDHYEGEALSAGDVTSSRDALDELSASLEWAMENLSGQIMMHFVSSITRLAFIKAEYEKPERDEYGHINIPSSPFSLVDAVRPLLDPGPHFLMSSTLFPLLQLHVSTKMLANEITRSYDVESSSVPVPVTSVGGAPSAPAAGPHLSRSSSSSSVSTNSVNVTSPSASPYFHCPLDIFKSSEKGDFPYAIAVNSVDNRFVAIATSKGIREIHIPNTLRYRKRNAALQLEEEEAADWSSCLHRYDNREKADFQSFAPSSLVGPLSSLSNLTNYPNPKFVLACALHTKITRGSSLVPSSLHATRVYDEFSCTAVKEMLSFSSTPPDREHFAACLAAHPSQPFYLSVSGSLPNRIYLWHYGWPNAVAEFTTRIAITTGNGQRRFAAADAKSNTERITRIKFNSTGNKFGATTDSGKLIVWIFQYRVTGLSGTTPSDSQLLPAYETFDVHSKSANDLIFIDGGNLIATAGDSSNGLNVCIWSLLLPLEERLIVSFKCHEHTHGATSLAYIPQTNLLITSGKGGINIFSLSSLSLIRRFDFHKNVRAHRMMYDSWTNLLFAGFNDGSIRIWSANAAANWPLLAEYSELYSKHTFFNMPGSVGSSMMSSYGVTDVVVTGKHILVCGSDGSVKYLRKKLFAFAPIQYGVFALEKASASHIAALNQPSKESSKEKFPSRLDSTDSAFTE